jgi:hypothetical protein
MPLLRVKEQFRPTLPELLAPRWQRASRLRRRAISAGVAALVVAAAAIAIFYPRDPWIVHAGAPLSFSLQYPRALHRVATPPGAYALAEERSHARLIESLEVSPLRLPPYRGEVSGILPIYADDYVRTLAAEQPNFALVSEGKTRVATIPGYWLSYSATLRRQTVYGRVIFLVPRLGNVRDGVTLQMLSTPRSDAISPDQVAVNDDLYEPLHTFRF